METVVKIKETKLPKTKSNKNYLSLCLASTLCITLGIVIGYAIWNKKNEQWLHDEYFDLQKSVNIKVQDNGSPGGYEVGEEFSLGNYRGESFTADDLISLQMFTFYQDSTNPEQVHEVSINFNAYEFNKNDQISFKMGGETNMQCYLWGLNFDINYHLEFICYIYGKDSTFISDCVKTIDLSFTLVEA